MTTEIDAKIETNPTGHRKELTIARVFAAPRSVVYEALTTAEHLMQWWGPRGLKMSLCNIDVRPGCAFHYCTQSLNGMEMCGKWIYSEVVEQEKLVFISSFADRSGNIIRHPMFYGWPMEILNIWTLTENNGQTTLSIHAYPNGADESEWHAFGLGLAAMELGFSGTLDQLADFVVSLTPAGNKI